MRLKPGFFGSSKQCQEGVGTELIRFLRDFFHSFFSVLT